MGFIIPAAVATIASLGTAAAGTAAAVGTAAGGALAGSGLAAAAGGIGAAAGAGAGAAGLLSSLGPAAITTGGSLLATALRGSPKPPAVPIAPTAPNFTPGSGGNNLSLAAQSPFAALGGTAGGVFGSSKGGGKSLLGGGS